MSHLGRELKVLNENNDIILEVPPSHLGRELKEAIATGRSSAIPTVLGLISEEN